MRQEPRQKLQNLEYIPKKNTESPARSPVPGLTAIHDSQWWESSVPGPHVPGFGNVCPGGTG